MATAPPHYQPTQAPSNVPLMHQQMGGQPIPMGHYQPAPAQVSVPLMPQAMVVQPVGPKPMTTTCRNCHSQVITRTAASPSSKTHLIALLCCVLGCWLCCCIPYCVDSCQNIEHYCPACDAFIGSYAS